MLDRIVPYRPNTVRQCERSLILGNPTATRSSTGKTLKRFCLKRRFTKLFINFFGIVFLLQCTFNQLICCSTGHIYTVLLCKIYIRNYFAFTCKHTSILFVKIPGVEIKLN